jgi:hypothetical protein
MALPSIQPYARCSRWSYVYRAHVHVHGGSLALDLLPNSCGRHSYNRRRFFELRARKNAPIILQRKAITLHNKNATN